MANIRFRFLLQQQLADFLKKNRTELHATAIEVMYEKKLFKTFIIFFCISFASSEIVTAGIVAVGSAISAGFFAGFNVINCLINECCDDKWISANYTGMTTLLKAFYTIRLLYYDYKTLL